MPRLRGERFLDAPEGRFPPLLRVGAAAGAVLGTVGGIVDALRCGGDCSAVPARAISVVVGCGLGAFAGYVVAVILGGLYMLLAAVVDWLHRLLFERRH